MRSGGREDGIEHQRRALPLHELQLYAASDPEAPVGCRQFSRSGITVADSGSDLLARRRTDEEAVAELTLAAAAKTLTPIARAAWPKARRLIPERRAAQVPFAREKHLLDKIFDEALGPLRGGVADDGWWRRVCDRALRIRLNGGSRKDGAFHWLP